MGVGYGVAERRAPLVFVRTSRPHPRGDHSTTLGGVVHYCEPGDSLCRFEGVSPSTQVGHLRSRGTPGLQAARLQCLCGRAARTPGGAVSQATNFFSRTSRPRPRELPLPPQGGGQ